MLKFLKNISLKTIYLSALTVAFAITFLMFAIFDVHSQQQQTEAALLEEARTFAREMDAVWQFMDNSQRKINYTSDGIYEFKGLHCAVVGKSVGTIFSKNNNYTIRYTNFNPRNYQGEPDPYESEALTELTKTPRSPNTMVSLISREWSGFATFRHSKSTRAALNAMAIRLGKSISRVMKRKVGRLIPSAAPLASSFRSISSKRLCAAT